MEFTKKTFSHIIPNVSIIIEDSSMMSLASGVPTKTHNSTHLNGMHSRTKMNEFPGLTWEFSEPSTSVDFMDMTITINKSNNIETTLFEKMLNLHLYIPPPPQPGLLLGIIYSTLFRIFTLSSSENDKLQQTKVFSNV